MDFELVQKMHTFKKKGIFVTIELSNENIEKLARMALEQVSNNSEIDAFDKGFQAAEELTTAGVVLFVANMKKMCKREYHQKLKKAYLETISDLLDAEVDGLTQ